MRIILREAEFIKKLIGWSPNAKAKLKRISVAKGISTGTVKRGMIYRLASERAKDSIIPCISCKP